MAEPLLGLWDLARNLFRRADPQYFPGKRGTPEGRRILQALAETLPAIDFLTCYSPSAEPRTIDLAVVLELSEGGDELVEIPVKELHESLSILRVAFESVLHLHGTPFWERANGKHRQLVDSLLTDLRYPPDVLHVRVPSSLVTSAESSSYAEYVHLLVEKWTKRTRP